MPDDRLTRRAFGVGVLSTGAVLFAGRRATESDQPPSEAIDEPTADETYRTGREPGREIDRVEDIPAPEGSDDIDSETTDLIASTHGSLCFCSVCRRVP